MVRFATLFVTMLFLCVSIAGCKGHTKESLNEEGMALFKQGNFNGAIVHYKNALEKDPNFMEARFNLGLAYVETGKLDQAEKEFQKVQLQSPRDSRVSFQLARIANFQNKPAVAVPLLTSYLEEHPDDPGALEQMAFSASLSGDLTTAREHLEKTLSIEPGRVSAKLALIQTYMSQADRSKARQALEALLAQEPKNRVGLHLLAQLEAQESDPEGMLDVYARISSMHPTDLYARYKEGSLLMDKGEGDKVRASAEAMIKEYPNKPEGHRLMGLYLAREGRYDEAVTALQKSISLQPDLETYYLLGLAYYYQNNLEMAVTQLQTVLDYSPAFVQARAMLAEIFLRQGRGNEALDVAEKMVETNAQDFRGYALKADALMLLNKLEDALAVLGRATELAPEHYGLLVKKGLLELSTGNLAGGEQDLLAALKVSPQGMDARMALHAFYMRAGRMEESTEILTKGLTGTKADAAIYNALAKSALGRKDAQGAEGYLLKARESDPAFLQTYYNGAVLKVAHGKPEEAVDQYDLALALAPEDVRSLTASAVLLDRLGKSDAARTRLEKARATGDMGSILMLTGFLQRHEQSDAALTVLTEELAKKPGNLVLVLAKAKAHILRKEVDQAMALYGQLEAADPWTGLMERARAWLALGDQGKAEEAARKLMGLSPDKAQSYLPLASILEGNKDRAGAEAVLKKALDTEPNNSGVAVMLGEFYLRGRELDKAEASFDRAQKAAPLSAQALTGQGVIAQIKNDLDRAAKLYLQAVQAAHDYVPALNNLAMIWADDPKNRDQAVNLAMAAFVRASDDPSVIDTLGYALIRNKRAEEAVKVLEHAKALAPQFAPIHYHLALALNEIGRTEEALTAVQTALAAGDFDERGAAEKLLNTLQKK